MKQERYIISRSDVMTEVPARCKDAGFHINLIKEWVEGVLKKHELTHEFELVITYKKRETTTALRPAIPYNNGTFTL